ncbi:Enterobactin exporter EntS [Candidatus Entotheonellaceae bacterium PAL068K]
MARTDPPKAWGSNLKTFYNNGLKPALRLADFRRLWLATVSSQSGQGMQQVLLGWLVLAMTDSEGMVGVIFAIRSAPNLVVGLVIGVLTDRLDRRLLMRLAVCGMALSSLTMAWLAFADWLQVWQLLVYAGVLGTLQALSITARQVYVYDMLETSGATQGIALISMAQRCGGGLGALLAGATLQWWGPGAAFLVMGLSYSASLVGLWVLRQAGTAAPRSREPLWDIVRVYMGALRTNQVMRSLMVSTAAAETLGFSHQVMVPILAKEVLQVGAAGLGVLTAFRFIGGILGAGLLTVRGEAQRQGAVLLLVLMLFGGGQVFLAQASHFWQAVGCVTFINVMASIADILHQTLLQYSVPNEQRGRAMGSWVVGLGTAPMGQLEIGYLASLTSARAALAINGLALVALTLGLTLLLPRLRRL